MQIVVVLKMSSPFNLLRGFMSGKPSKEIIVMPILVALSLSHFTNDMIQSLLPAIYPILKSQYALSFTEVGIITLTYQLTASLLQPIIGFFTDKKPLPYTLPFGMFVTLCGLLQLSQAASFPAILIGAAMVGMGSSIFHPESSRMARAAAGGKHGFAQSFFQIGGNTGSAMGPLLAAFIILPYGQGSIAKFSLVALAAILVLTYASTWYKTHHLQHAKKAAKQIPVSPFTRRKIIISMGVLMLLVFSKYFYLASLQSYYTFYLIDKFHLSTESAQLHLFVFLAAVAAGTLAGGPIGDKIGRKTVIWWSILGVLPFTLALPYANLFATEILSVVIGLILASAFSAIIVYAQELAPGRTGMIAGLFFGFAFGMGGLGAAVFGTIADHYSIGFVYQLASYLPALGILTVFLPNVKKRAAPPASQVLQSDAVVENS
jgi:FSR family fosmidomycin resistance protein-like MFS transporter